jgi:hypothetical protein
MVVDRRRGLEDREQFAEGQILIDLLLLSSVLARLL